MKLEIEYSCGIGVWTGVNAKLNRALESTLRTWWQDATIVCNSVQFVACVHFIVCNQPIIGAKNPCKLYSGSGIPQNQSSSLHPYIPTSLPPYLMYSSEWHTIEGWAMCWTRHPWFRTTREHTLPLLSNIY